MIPNTGWAEFLGWILRLRLRFSVTGASMFPILKPGDQVLIDRRAYRRKAPKRGDIVIALHPGRSDLKIIKRVTAANPDGTYDLAGENPLETTDFRAVPASKIVGKVTSVFHSGEKE